MLVTVAGDIFPRAGPRPTKDHAEPKVYAALAKALPDGWRAWHSLKLRVSGEWEGEGDFVIASPDAGLVCLEVKGGRITLEDGCWYQNGRRLERPPRDQAMSLARNLAKEIARRGADSPPYDGACAFPDVPFSEGPKTGDLTGLVLGPHELDWLEKALPALVERALGHRRAPRNRKWMGVLHEIWGETWAPHVRLEDKVERNAERAVELDREQLKLLDMAGRVPCALVSGRAGSGKTVVARELCTRRAREGSRTLYLCFTDALGRVVDNGFAPLRDEGLNVRAAPVRRYAAELLSSSAAELARGGKAFWDEVSFRAADSAVPADDERPDLIVVDEGQDLEENDWLLVSELARDRNLWVFHDPAQSFWTDRGIPDAIVNMAGAPLELPRQHRNPVRVDELAAMYREAGRSASVNNGKGRRSRRDSSLQAVRADGAKLLERVERELDSLRSRGAKPSEIAILTLAGQSNSELLKQRSLGKHRLARADDDDAASSIIADTFLRFKGLERPFVIVTEVSRGKLSRYDTRMHIALTRATVSATVVCSDAAAAEDSRLLALVGD